ncbi:MAG: polyribonucleotide nucleotidyltransferase [Bacteroidia bacterium]
MDPSARKVERFSFPSSAPIELFFGDIARQADGSVFIRSKDTLVLCTICSSPEYQLHIDFLPLTVDYRENFASSGRIPGGFFKRDGRPNEGEILVSRLIDRSLRPFFPSDYRAEIQVICTLESYDPEAPPDILAGLGASAALALSDIPCEEEVSMARVVRKDGQFYLNPPVELCENAELDIVVSGTDTSIVMVEGELKEVEESVLVEALAFAHPFIRAFNGFLRQLRQQHGKPKREYPRPYQNPEIQAFVEGYAVQLEEIILAPTTKAERRQAFDALESRIVENLLLHNPEFATLEAQKYVHYVYNQLKRKLVRKAILETGTRLDGRKTDEIRPISCEVGLLPRVHGSALFTRGETQALASVTVGTRTDEQIIDYATYQGTKKFLLQYNFPPFSTGEVKPLRAPSRREIGHSNLAERALKAITPTHGDWGEYTIRVVSDILESNGSSSMATVCAGCLGLMDAGVAISTPVAGIAMGLIWEEGKYAILSDILGDEDALGDMDFKVAGSAKGITAVQMDIKIQKLPYEILQQALEQARRGRLFILEKMLAILPAPRPVLSPLAPRIYALTIPASAIGAVIGTGGKVIQEIQRQTGTEISIDQNGEEGKVVIYAKKQADADAAKKWIEEIVSNPVEGEIYDAKVKIIKESGAVVEFMRGKEAFLHISEISEGRIPRVQDVLSLGQELQVRYLGMDTKTGKHRVSIRAVQDPSRAQRAHLSRPHPPRHKSRNSSRS